MAFSIISPPDELDESHFLHDVKAIKPMLMNNNVFIAINIFVYENSKYKLK